MNKMIWTAVLSVGVLAGCVSNSPRKVPVVESGTQLSPGPLRDMDARSAVLSGQQDEGVTVMTPPEAGIPAISSDSLPSAPIQADDSFGRDTAVFDAAPIASEPATSVATARRTIDAPVQALLNTAQQQRNKADLNGAASSLERALRIAPTEPQVLYRLSEIRLMQGDAAQAEQLAQRGLSYSHGSPALQAGLWDLIAEAREKQGNAAGAAEAKQKSKAFM